MFQVYWGRRLSSRHIPPTMSLRFRPPASPIRAPSHRRFAKGAHWFANFVACHLALPLGVQLFSGGIRRPPRRCRAVLSSGLGGFAGADGVRGNGVRHGGVQFCAGEAEAGRGAQRDEADSLLSERNLCCHCLRGRVPFDWRDVGGVRVPAAFPNKTTNPQRRWL